MVNSFRVTWNDTTNSLNDPPETFFDAPQFGIKVYTYCPARWHSLSPTASRSQEATPSR